MQGKSQFERGKIHLLFSVGEWNPFGPVVGASVVTNAIRETKARTGKGEIFWCKGADLSDPLSVKVLFNKERKTGVGCRSFLAAPTPGFLLLRSIKLEVGNGAIHSNALDLESADLTSANIGKRHADIQLVLADDGFIAGENLHFAHGERISITLCAGSLEFLRFIDNQDKPGDPDPIPSSR